MNDPQFPGLEEILRRLAAVRRHEAGVQALRGFLCATTVLLTALIPILFIESLFPMPPAARTVLAVFFLAGGISALVGFVLLPLARRVGVLAGESDEGTAMRVGRAFPHINDRLLNILQLLRNREQARGYFSLELIDASARDLGPISNRWISSRLSRMMTYGNGECSLPFLLFWYRSLCISSAGRSALRHTA